MTTTTQFINEIENICDDLGQQQIEAEREANKKQITKLVNTYCEMHGWGAEDALTECLTNLVEMQGTTADAIERLNAVNDEYMEDR